MSLQDGGEERRLKDKNVFTWWKRRKKCVYIVREGRKETKFRCIHHNQLKRVDIYLQREEHGLKFIKAFIATNQMELTST